MKYRLAIFDFDGTLADSFSWFLAAVNGIADSYGFRRIDNAELGTLRGFDARTLISHLGIPKWKMPLITRHIRAQLTKEIHQIARFPGVDQMLMRLHSEDMVLAIVTSNTTQNVLHVLGDHNFALIKYHACDAPLLGKRFKLRRLISQSKIPRAQIIFIGDEIRDLQAARSEKIAFGAVSWGYNNTEALTKNAPDEVFTSMAEIVEKLSQQKKH